MLPFFFFLHEHHTVSFSLSERFDRLIPMYYETYCVNNRAQEFWAFATFETVEIFIFLYSESDLVFLIDHFNCRVLYLFHFRAPACFLAKGANVG